MNKPRREPLRLHDGKLRITALFGQFRGEEKRRKTKGLAGEGGSQLIVFLVRRSRLVR
ncbi:MAG: hypothetical protein L0Z07_06625 [Planctomycetes bacterium]|nr:hypothetical protein [Planctomycetota bacterium]